MSYSSWSSRARGLEVGWSGRKLTVAVAMTALLVGGCASTDRLGNDALGFDGAISAQSAPVNAQHCGDVEWRTAERVPPKFPTALGRHLDPSQDWSMSLAFSFDVEPDGSTGNIRFLAPQEYTRHAATRSAIRRSAEAIAQWRFEHDGPSGFVTDCFTTISFGA